MKTEILGHGGTDSCSSSDLVILLTLPQPRQAVLPQPQRLSETRVTPLHLSATPSCTPRSFSVWHFPVL
jgi:hypothetical protein